MWPQSTGTGPVCVLRAPAARARAHCLTTLPGFSKEYTIIPAFQASPWLLSLTGALAAAFAAPVPAQEQRFSARFITPGISAIHAAAMNESGDVVGTSTSGSGGWVSRAGEAAVLLPLPPGASYSFAHDISDTGVIVGSVASTSYPGFGTAAAWIPDGSGGYTIQQFGTLPGHVHSGATAVNNVGDIIGSSSNGTFSYPVLFSALGGIQDLSATGIFDPIDINDHRVIVDHSFTARRLDLNTMIVEDLGTPDISYLASKAEVINEAGQVAGSVILACCHDCDHKASRYTDGTGWEVRSGCGQMNSAWDMNDLGDIVMRLNVAPYVRLQGVGTFRIEDLIVDEVGHWYVINGYGLAINNSRQMAVPATNDTTGEGGIILLTPISGNVPGDVDGDGIVGFSDLLGLLASWGECSEPCPPSCPADFNDDCAVGIVDLIIVLANWT